MDTPSLTRDKKIILDYLQSHSDRKISVLEMLGKLQSEGFKMSRRGLRMVFEDMIKNYGCLVGSTDKGLFYFHTKELMLEARNYEKKSAISRLIKSNWMVGNWNLKHNDNVKQLDIFEYDKVLTA